MLVKKVMKEMNDLIEHHQLQVINLEEMLEEERQAAQMNENAANHVIAELRKEISRYREALEFYADEENYKPFDGIFLSSYQNKVDEDGGEKARKALEGEE